MDLSMYPDWDNAESLGTNVILACALSPPFALLFVALRFHTARTILRTVRLDDCKYPCSQLSNTLLDC